MSEAETVWRPADAVKRKRELSNDGLSNGELSNDALSNDARLVITRLLSLVQEACDVCAALPTPVVMRNGSLKGSTARAEAAHEPHVEVRLFYDRETSRLAFYEAGFVYVNAGYCKYDALAKEEPGKATTNAMVDALLATLCHELAHHVVQNVHGKTGHGPAFADAHTNLSELVFMPAARQMERLRSSRRKQKRQQQQDGGRPAKRARGAASS
jgi:hypothetical protein